MPCSMAIKTISFPEYFVMIGRVVSIVVAPPAHIGAKRLKNFTKTGAPSNAIISRIIFVINAIVPNSVASCMPDEAVFSSVMRMDDSE